MLTNVDKKRIIDLRSQGYSYKKIHQKLGFSIDTIMKVCRKEKRNNQEREDSQIKNIRNEDSENGEYSIKNGIIEVINKAKLIKRKNREQEKLLDVLQTMIISEFDERIPKIKDDAIKEGDIQWRREIEKKYVRKEIVINLENEIKEKDEIIKNQKNIIQEKNKSLTEKDNKLLDLEKTKDIEIQELKDKYGKIYNKNIQLENENLALKEINKQLNLDVKIQQDQLNKEIDNINNYKKNYSRYIKNKEIIADCSSSLVKEKLKTLDIREKKLDKKDEEIKQRENELYKTIEKIQEYVNEKKSKLKKINESILKQLYFIKKIYEPEKNKEIIITK